MLSTVQAECEARPMLLSLQQLLKWQQACRREIPFVNIIGLRLLVLLIRQVIR